MSAERAVFCSRNVTVRTDGARPAERFVVTEVEGYSIGGPDQWTPRLSVQVLDSAYCFGIVAEWNEEAMRWVGTQTDRQAAMRARARGLAAILNARETRTLNSESRAAIRQAIDATKRERLKQAGTLYVVPPIPGFREHGANGYRRGCRCETCRDGEAARRREWRRLHPEETAAARRRERQRRHSPGRVEGQ